MRAILWYMSRLAQFWNADKQIVNIWEPSGQPVVLDRCEDQHHLTKLNFCCRNAKKCLFCLEKLILPHFWHKYFKDIHAKHIVPRNLSSILKVGWKKDERECTIVKPRSKVKSCLIKANHICRNFLMSNPVCADTKSLTTRLSNIHQRKTFWLLTRSGGGLVGLPRSWTARGAWASNLTKLDVGGEPARIWNVFYTQMMYIVLI